MTAIYYPDCQATSPNGRFTLEARSPHNGSICHRHGRRPSEDEFGFKYREHQSNFRYQLLDNVLRQPPGGPFSGCGRRLVWERWQERWEDSPHELVVSEDGWCVLRTHGFRPEVIAVSPAGKDALRVCIAGPGGEHCYVASSPATAVASWSPDNLAFSTAGLYWARNSWPYFLHHTGSPHFIWRTALGQRLVINLGQAAVLPEKSLPAEVERSLDEEEKRGVAAFLAELVPTMNDVGRLLSRRGGEDARREPLAARLRLVPAALHLVGVHRLAGCMPFLRAWEGIDCPSHSQGSDAMPDGWWYEAQRFRPVVHHSIRLLGEEPEGYATYHFTNFGDNTGRRFPVPEHVPDRHARVARLGLDATAEVMLEFLGSPDFIRKDLSGAGAPGWRPKEEWEYDFRVGGWVTLRIQWEGGDRRGRMPARRSCALTGSTQTSGKRSS